MFKRILSSTLVLIILSTGSVVSYSSGMTSNLRDESNIKINNKSNDIVVFRPEENLVTSDKTILLSGSGEKDSKIIIEVYSLSDSLRDKYSFENLPKEEDYLNPSKKEIKVGPFGIFLKELDLKLGINKIHVYKEGTEEEDKENIIEKYVFVKDKDKANKLIDDISKMGFSDVIKEIFKNTNVNNIH